MKYRTYTESSFSMKSIPPFLTSSNPELTSIPYRYKTEKDAFQHLSLHSIIPGFKSYS
ncbi:hypothetical protein [Flavobacterium sinopsychrotolerans]|uniref:hypothetical protein n=1 Tax=Flavobacterium sinopsychrotolerans TaxID=604089 RepID=UPI00142F3BB6|nr:hypothetical protein [Flavobacterium sinopsychrotolerans]